MKKLLVLLLGLMCIFVVAGCGKSDGIEGTWVPKMSDQLVVKSIQLSKQNEFSYKGIITYKDGSQFTSTFSYSKEYNAVEEAETDVLRKERELKKRDKWVMWFNNNYTEAKTDRAGTPKFIFVKQ